MNETWGGGDEEGEGVTPDQIRLKNGYLWLNRDAWSRILHRREIVEMVIARAQAMCDYANSMAQTRSANGEPLYTVTHPDPDDPETLEYTRFRAKVRPANSAGIRDNDEHFTLAQAAALFNDPKRPPTPAPPGAEYPPYIDPLPDGTAG